MHAQQPLAVPRSDVGRGAERAPELPLDGVARHEDHDDPVLPLVQSEQVDVGDGLTREQPHALQSEFGREHVPRGGYEREQFLAVRRAFHQPGGLRRHERPGSLIDAQHGGPILLDNNVIGKA